jgi:zinc protease
LKIRAQDTSDMASMTFDKILFKGHPYSRPDDGDLETIPRITRDDLVRFHSEHYGPRGMVIAIVGAVKARKPSDRSNARWAAGRSKVRRKWNFLR